MEIKIDIEKREITEDEAKEYAEKKKMKYFETSAKENKGVTEVFNEIFNDIYELNKNKINEKKDNFQLKEEPVKILKGKGLLAALSSIRESEEKLANSQPIVEADGVFSISENLRYNESNLDKSFQTLVHSVLKQ